MTPSKRIAVLAGALMLALQLACASSSPFNQDFVEVRTPNFHLTSSFGDAPTRALARDLEVFHAGVMALLGIDPNPTPSRPTGLTHLARPVRVVAFDGRGLSRPFAERGAAASLVPSIDGPLLMIRAIGGFSERVDPDLRHRYAHRILRDHASALLPLWYEEGRAQQAATIEQSGDVVLIGRSHPGHRRLLLDWRQTDLSPILQRHSLARASEVDRGRFEAGSWAIVNTLLFGSPNKRAGALTLDRVRSAAESKSAGAIAEATRALGSGEALSRRVYAFLEKDKHRVDRLQLGGLVLSDLELVPVPKAVAIDRLAELALELERPALAAEYFERAIRTRSTGDDRPESLASRAGLALAEVSAGRFDRFDERVAEITRSGALDSVTASRLGLALVVSARALPAGVARVERLDAARTQLERSLQLEPGRIEAQLGLAISDLVEGRDLVRARDAFEAIRRERPGSLEIEIWLARVQLELGRPNSARAKAEEVLSRSHARSLRQAALEILDQIESRGTR